MAQCIFCLRDFDELTDEHVFPAALGGVLTLTNSSCRECNQGFSKFEQAVAAELAPIRLVLQIPDRRGEIPQVAATVKTQTEEYEARVKGDGSVQLKPIIREIVGPGGRKEISYQFATERQKEKLRAEAERKGEKLIESGPGKPEIGEVHFGGDLNFIGAQEGLRLAAKIAFVGLTLRAGIKFTASDAFSEVREYIRAGNGGHISRIFVHERFLNQVQLGPHQHAIIVAARHDKARIDAIVRLFGGLCYFVVLSDHYGGADFAYTIACDAHRGEVSGVLQSHVDAEMAETEDVATSGETVWDNLFVSGEHFIKFIEAAIESKLKRDRAANPTGGVGS